MKTYLLLNQAPHMKTMGEWRYRSTHS